MSHPTRSVQRVRHPLHMRRLQVLRSEQVSPHFKRITLGGPELAGFLSASFDDHLKLILPSAPGAALVLPSPPPEGQPPVPPAGPRPTMRDYTPRRYDPVAGELDIEFALHGEGPAASWAAQAAPGQEVGIGGPRGSFIVPLDYDWHLLIGDASALPAIARRLEELPAGVHAIVRIAVDEADQRPLPSAASLDLQWLPTAADGAPLLAAARALTLPAGDGYAWAAGEAKTMAALRALLISEQGLSKEQMRVAAYWKQGAAGHHENLQD